MSFEVNELFDKLSAEMKRQSELPCLSKWDDIQVKKYKKAITQLKAIQKRVKIK